MEDDLLTMALDGRRKVYVLLGERLALLPGRAEDLFESGSKQGRDRGQVVRIADHPVIEAVVLHGEPVPPSFLDWQERGHLLLETGGAVGCQPHHLVLVPVMGEAEVLGEGCIEEAHARRKIEAIEHLDVRPLAPRHHRRREVSRTIDAEDSRLLKWRAEEGRGQVTPMVLDELNFGPDHLRVHAELHLLETLVELLDVVLVGGPLGPHGPSRTWVLDDEPGLAVPFGGRVSTDGDGGYILKRTIGLLEAELDGLGRKARPMLHSPKPLFLSGHEKLAVDEDGRRTVSVVGVESKDNHDSSSRTSSHIAANSRSCVIIRIKVPRSALSLRS